MGFPKRYDGELRETKEVCIVGWDGLYGAVAFH